MLAQSSQELEVVSSKTQALGLKEVVNKQAVNENKSEQTDKGDTEEQGSKQPCILGIYPTGTL